MKTILTTLAVAGTLGLAAPALAQPVGAPGWTSVDAQQTRIDARIDRGVRDGSLTRREASKLRANFHSIQRLEARYLRNDGRIDRREGTDLTARLQGLNAQVFAERHDVQDRGDHRRGRG